MSSVTTGHRSRRYVRSGSVANGGNRSASLLAPREDQPNYDINEEEDSETVPSPAKGGLKTMSGKGLKLVPPTNAQESLSLSASAHAERTVFRANSMVGAAVQHSMSKLLTIKPPLPGGTKADIEAGQLSDNNSGDCVGFVQLALGLPRDLRYRFGPVILGKTTAWSKYFDFEYLQGRGSAVLRPGDILGYPAYTTKSGARVSGHVIVVVDPATDTGVDLSSGKNGIVKRKYNFALNKEGAYFVRRREKP